MLAVSLGAFGQAGRRPSTSGENGVLVNVVARRTDSSPKPITSKQVAIYDNGIEQTIQISPRIPRRQTSFYW